MTNEHHALLYETVSKLLTTGKGILALDESPATATKRLQDINVESTEETRRQYRELFLGTPELSQYVTGVILPDEGFWQKIADSVTFPEYLTLHDVIPGIKVDEGLVDDARFPGETITRGLDGLEARLKKYFAGGARFCKWRAAFTIDSEAQLPSEANIRANAHDMALYAACTQQAGLVPIVEPEVLMEGSHSHDVAQEVLKKVLTIVVDEIKKNSDVDPKGLIIKTGMVVPGKQFEHSVPATAIAEATVAVLKETVSDDIGGIVFLSGGQSPLEATENLNEISRMEPLPWPLAFSYARALQGPALKLWAGKRDMLEVARKEFVHRLKANSLADMGDYTRSFEEE